MKRGTTSKAIEKTIDYTFDGIHRAAPHVIKAYKLIANKVVIPAGLTVLSGVATVLATIIAPKRKR
jgi:hypothetical protein